MTVGLKSFQNSTAGMSGFGAGTEQDIAELSKALSAGYQVSGQTGGSALRVESLEASLKVLTYTSSHIKLWKKIPKSPAFSTVEEYNQLTTYGGQQNPFVQEGELPQATDTQYARRVQLVKFLGTTREVTHQASLVHPAHGDLIALENQSGILWLLEQVERNLFSGDSSLSFDGEAEQWDGLDALIDSAQVIDMEGSTLQEADLEEAANEIIENYGFPTDIFLGTRTMSDLVKTLYPRERIALPAPQNGQIGNSIQTVSTQAGILEFNPDVFIRKNPSPPATATSANAPAAPTVVATLQAAETDGDFTKGSTGAASDYFNYVVTAANRFGESAPSLVSASVAMTLAQRGTGANISVVINNAAAIGAFPPEYFRIYRTSAMSSDLDPATMSSYSLVAQIRATTQTAGAANTAWVDNNLTLPFTSTAYVGELTPSVLTFRQLMPMMKMDLAVLSPAYRWMILLYGTPILFAPKKWIRLINIGQLSAR